MNKILKTEATLLGLVLGFGIYLGPALGCAHTQIKNSRKISFMVTRSFENKEKRFEEYEKRISLEPNVGKSASSLAVGVNQYKLAVSTSKTFQKMVGFGAALTEASVINILKLPVPQQEELLMTLFDTKKGGGLNVIRVPMGSSDLADGSKGEYTYDDTPNGVEDPELKYFSMARDLKTLKLLNRILSINPSVKIMINPWSGPAWMKDNHSLYRGHFESKNNVAFANYFIRTIEEYHKHGIEVHYVGIQNEPGISIEYPSMLMSDEQQAEFIQILGARLEQKSFAARIIANDDNYIAISRVKKLLGYPTVAKQIGVVGFHCWSNDPEKALEVPPNIVMFETECGGNINSQDYGYDFYWWLNKRVIDGSNFGLSAVITWNMVSDENAGPHGAGPDGCTTCRGLVTINPIDKNAEKNKISSEYEIEINSEFRALMHASRFVKRGAQRISSILTFEGNDSKVIKHTAFKNPDGSVVLIIGNSGEESFPLKLVLDNQPLLEQKINAKESMTLVIH